MGVNEPSAYIIYTPNLGLRIAVPGQEREQRRFRVSSKGALREHEGASREHRGALREHGGAPREQEGALRGSAGRSRCEPEIWSQQPSA